MKTIDKVAQMLSQGKTDSQIRKTLHLSTSSLGSYKAHITIREDKGRAFEKLEEYMQSPYIVIPKENVLKGLSPEEVAPFVGFLDKLLGGPENTKTKYTNRNPKINPEKGMLPSSEVRAIVIELMDGGLRNSQVYSHKSLRNANPNSVRSYMAHWTRGSYEDRSRVPD